MAEKFISPMNTVSDPDLGEQEFSDEEFESIGLSFMKLIKEAEETNQGHQPISQTGQGMGGTSAPPRKSLQQVHERIQGIRGRHSGQSKAPMTGNALQALVDQTQQRSTGMQQQGQRGMQGYQPSPMQGMHTNPMDQRKAEFERSMREIAMQEDPLPAKGGDMEYFSRPAQDAYLKRQMRHRDFPRYDKLQPMEPRYMESPRSNQQFYNSLSNMPGPDMFQPFQAVGYGGQ